MKIIYNFFLTKTGRNILLRFKKLDRYVANSFIRKNKKRTNKIAESIDLNIKDIKIVSK